MKLTSGQIKNSSLVAGSTITDALNTLRTSSGSGTGDMVKTVYDTDNDGKVDVANLADSVPWTGVTDKPVTFTPTLHNHSVSEVTGLQSALDGKASSTHTHAISDVTGLQTALDGKQDTLVSGTNIKTINGDSLLGSGNLVISGGDNWPAVPTKTSDLTNDSGFVTASTPVIASEPLTAGDWVSLWDSGGGARVRKSDHASLDKEVDGYVLVGVASGAVAEVFTSGMNTAVAGQQLGPVFAAATGAGSASVGAGAAFAQRIGTAVRPDAVVFSRGPAVGL